MDQATKVKDARVFGTLFDRSIQKLERCRIVLGKEGMDALAIKLGQVRILSESAHAK